MSIDIEGAEERALEGFPFDVYRFNCLTVERPSDKLQGALGIAGYEQVAAIPGLDNFYIHKSFRDEYHRNCVNFFENCSTIFNWV